MGEAEMIDYSQFAIPKGGDVVKLTPSQYSKRKRKVWEKQGQGCAHCFKGIGLNEMHLHHTEGRGLGGGKRNDLKTIGLCPDCHSREHQ